MFKFDKAFFGTLFSLAIPIIIQSLIMSSMNFIDTVMVGGLGSVSIAAVGISNQLFFLLNFFLFGVTSGTAVFTSQYWGKKDLKGIHKVLGLGLATCSVTGILFSAVSIVFPQFILGLYTQDQVLIKEGLRYLPIVGVSYFFTSVTFIFAAVSRSAGQVRLPLFVNIGAVLLNTGLNVILIYGYFGIPAMGVSGSATATLIARIFECLILVSSLYFRKAPFVSGLKNLWAFDKVLVRKFFKLCSPVILSEVFWSIGVAVYTMIYAHIGTESITAVNITASVEGLAFVVFTGITTACAINIGHRIGEGKDSEAFNYAMNYELVNFLAAIVVSLLIFLSKDFILGFFHVDHQIKAFASNLMTILALALWVKSGNMLQSGGILRSGGDTFFALIMDATTIWIMGVPVAIIGAFVFNFSIDTLVFLLMGEELVKYLIGLYRILSKKWINNLTSKTEKKDYDLDDNDFVFEPLPEV